MSKIDIIDAPNKRMFGFKCRKACSPGTFYKVYLFEANWDHVLGELSLMGLTYSGKFVIKTMRTFSKANGKLQRLPKSVALYKITFWVDGPVAFMAAIYMPAESRDDAWQDACFAGIIPSKVDIVV